MPIPSITLAEFNKIASGQQNAGQVDFAKNSDGEFTGGLVKINNHIIRKSLNGVHLTGADELSLGASAKLISREIGGSFWETMGTTTDRLVKGAKVLGENDDKNTNVDNIPLPEEEENQIDLEV